MIRVERRPEPPALQVLRDQELDRLRSIWQSRQPGGDDIQGYNIVANLLWEGQKYKCCYCEQKIPLKYNDVEHYRPKCRADRQPGSSANYGYWWLAFSWENLLFACPHCNRSGKNDKFPLAIGSVPLQAEEWPPGKELPLLLDPTGILNPVEHIEFRPVKGRTVVNWRALARDGSFQGEKTIDVCRLNDTSNVELRDDHVKNIVQRQVDALV